MPGIADSEQAEISDCVWNTAVFSVVTQRPELRDNTKNGCVADTIQKFSGFPYMGRTKGYIFMFLGKTGGNYKHKFPKKHCSSRDHFDTNIRGKL